MLLVLSAINEDSPTVPALLTDYILNGTVSFVSSVLIFNFFYFIDNGTCRCVHYAKTKSVIH